MSDERNRPTLFFFRKYHKLPSVSIIIYENSKFPPGGYVHRIRLLAA